MATVLKFLFRNWINLLILLISKRTKVGFALIINYFLYEALSCERLSWFLTFLANIYNFQVFFFTRVHKILVRHLPDLPNRFLRL